MKNAWKLGAALVGALLISAPALAQDGPARARALYNECKEHMEGGRPCQALVACEAGLEAMDLSTLRRLTDRARHACVGEQRERRRRRQAEQRCPAGQERVGGHCCWPGQAWSEETSRCAGVPSACPVGFYLDAAAELCTQTACPDGQTHVDETHCCWPEQVWFEGQRRCLGIPACPAGLSAEGEQCVVKVPDQDLDGIADAEDQCPTSAEDDDGFEDGDGCPELDDDGDGLCDPHFAARGDAAQGEAGFFELECVGADSCPTEPEDLDGFEDGDGCPDLDNDRDRVADVDDLCPLEFGVPAHSGCMPPPDHTLKIVGWSGVGVGVGLMATGLGFYLSANTDRDALNSPQVSSQDSNIVLSLTEVEARALNDSINEKETVAAITLGVGGALLTAGGVLLVLDALRDEPSPQDLQEDEAAVELSIAPSPGGGAFFTLGGSF